MSDYQATDKIYEEITSSIINAATKTLKPVTKRKLNPKIVSENTMSEVRNIE